MKTGEVITTKQRAAARTRQRIPAKTREMIRLVLNAADEVDWPHVFFQRADADSTPQPVLRSLAIYCLANNFCGAQEIELACIEDQGAEYLAAGYRPRWRTIHEFRRRNADPLKEALALVFQGLAARESASSPGECSPVRFNSATAFAEANDRLIRAMQADSMLMDW